MPNGRPWQKLVREAALLPEENSKTGLEGWLAHR